MKNELTTSELAKLLGLSVTRVTELTRSGVIPKAGRGCYILNDAVKSYCAHLRERAGNMGRPSGSGQTPDETKRLKTAQAELAELKIEQARGKLVSIASVTHEWQSVLRYVRSGVLAIPSRVGSRLGHLTPTDLDTIDREIRDVLAELAEGDSDAA